MSYIQMKIGGEPRGLKFNQMAVVTMTKYLDFENVPATYGYALVYSGLVASCYVKREEPNFTFEQVCDWVDELSIEELTQIRDKFEETQAFKNLINGSTEEQTKKKQKSTKEKV
jgi:hypothetical protein